MPRGLDLRTIVAASLSIADAEGVGSLTMRRVSTELGVTPMALYRHVDNKDALVALVLDESMRAVDDVDPDGDAASELTRWGVGFYELLVGHPSLAQEMSSRRLEGPVATEAATAILALLRNAGLDDSRADELLISLFSHTLGAALYRVSRRRAMTQLGERHLRDTGERITPFRRRLSTIEPTDAIFGRGLRFLIDGHLEPIEGRTFSNTP